MVFLRFILLGFLPIGLWLDIYSSGSQVIDNQYLIENSSPSLALNSSYFLVDQTVNYYPHAVLTPASAKSSHYFVVTTNDDEAETNENTAVSIKVLENDTNGIFGTNPASVDLDVSQAGVQPSFSLPGGDFEVDADGVVVFTPSLNFSGAVSIKYTVNDNLGFPSNEATITVTVNDSPVAIGENFETKTNAAITFNVTGNDTDSDGTISPATVDLDVSTTTIQSSITTTKGTYTVNTLNGDVTYTPALNFHGLAQLSYTVIDNDGAISNEAIIEILVNDPPVANEDLATTNEDVQKIIDILSNDSDADGTIVISSVDLDPSQVGIQSVRTTTEGKFTVNTTTGILTYEPLLNFNGEATVNYTIKDNKGEVSNEAIVKVTVIPVNDPPKITGQQSLAVDEDQSLTLQLSNLTVTDVDNTYPAGFSIELVAGTNYTVSGSTIIPSPNFFGTLTVSTKVSDGTLSSPSYNLQVTVNPINDPPSFDPIADVTISENAGTQTVTISNISPGAFESQTLLLIASSGNTSLIPTPTVSYNGTATSTTISFKPQPSQTGTAEITIRMIDNGPSEFTRTFQVNVVSINDAPTLNAIGNVTMQEDAAQQDIALSGITAGPSENQALSLTASSNNASLFETLDIIYVSPQTTGTLRIKPKPNVFGTATVTVLVTDDGPSTPPPSVNTFSRTFTVTVNSVNDAPVITGQESLAVAEDQSIVLQLSNLIVTDPDDTYPGTFTLQIGAGANYSVSGSTITPSPNFFGTLTISSVTVNDGKVNSVAYTTLQITVSPVNDAPTLDAIGNVTMLEDAAQQNISLTGITTGPSNEIQNLTVGVSSNNASLFETLDVLYTSSQTTGTVRIKPKANIFGTATVTVTVTDDGASTPAPNVNTFSRTFTVTVNSVNDTPVITGQQSLAVAEDQSIVLQLSNLIVTDPDDAYPGTFTLQIGAGANYSVSGSTITPSPNFFGTLTISSVTVNDGKINSAAYTTLQITVSPVNDAPTLDVIGNVTMLEDAAQQNISLTGITTGPSNEIQNLTVGVSSNNASLFETLDVLYTSSQTTGTVRVKPKANIFGTATVTVAVTDDGASTPAPNVNTFSRTFTVTVNSVNDAPVITGQQSLAVAEDQSIVLQLSNLIVTDPDDAYPGTFTLQIGAGANYSVSGSTITPSPNFFGTLTISSVTVNDGKTNSAAYTTLQITVSPVNDAPTLDAISSVPPVQEDDPQQNISLLGITAGPNESQGLSVSVSSNNAGIFEVLDVVYASAQSTGTLRVKPKHDAYGTATVTVTVTDDGASTPTPNVNTFSRTFTLNVTAVNDLPEFKTIPLTAAIVGEVFSDSIKVEDVDNASVTLSAVTKPAWLTFTVSPTGKKAKLSGTPPIGSGGKVSISLQAKDAGSPVSQNYEIIVNTRPVVTPFLITTNEDIVHVFSTVNFTNVFTDVDGNALAEIQITSLPKHGILKLNETLINAGTKITTPSIGSLKYIPNANYNGKDTLYWKGNDGSAYSLTEAYVNFIVSPVNDAPVIEALEEDALLYEIGKDKVKLTSIFFASDIERDSLVRAEIGFRRENYNAAYDVLTYSSTVSAIKGSFDAQSGTLLLTGKASVADYIKAIRSIDYSHINVLNPELVSKSIYFTISDGKALSNTVDREVKLIYTFQDLEIVNGFTPNGDGDNDVWVAIKPEREADLAQSTIQIYSKHGVLVFESKGFEKKWDGTYKGKLLPSDSYFYTIEVVDSKLKSLKKPYKGVVTILHDKL